MSEFIYIYMYTSLQNAEGFLWFIYSAGLLSVGMGYLASAMSADLEYSGTAKRDSHARLSCKIKSMVKNKIIVIPFVFLCILTVFLPSKDDVKTIIAGGIAWKAGQNVSEVDGISELPENIVNAMNSFLIGIEEGSKKE